MVLSQPGATAAGAIATAGATATTAGQSVNTACMYHCCNNCYLIWMEMVPLNNAESSWIGSLVLMGTGLLTSEQPSRTYMT